MSVDPVVRSAPPRPQGTGAEVRNVGGQPPLQAPLALEDMMAERYDHLSETERVAEHYYDPNTGVVNERGFEALHGPHNEAAPLFAHYSIEGVKFVNDRFGHDQGQLLYRMAAQALHAVDPQIAKVRGDFAGRVITEERAKRNAERATSLLPAELRGFRITAKTGRTLEEAGAAHAVAKQQFEAHGVRAPRGERPKGVNVAWSPSTHPFPEHKVVARQLPELVAAHRALTRAEALSAYRDPLTGLLSSTGIGATAHDSDYILHFDLDGLKPTDQFHSSLGDEVIRRAGQIMSVLGGDDVKAAHAHGDEFEAGHPRREKLEKYAERVTEFLAALQVKYVDLQLGETFVQKGIGVSYGIGRTHDEAEQNLSAHKALRTQAGERDAKGLTAVAQERLDRRTANADEIAAALAQERAQLASASRRDQAGGRGDLHPQHDGRGEAPGDRRSDGEAQGHDRRSVPGIAQGRVTTFAAPVAPAEQGRVAEVLRLLPGLTENTLHAPQFQTRLDAPSLENPRDVQPAIWVSAPPREPVARVVVTDRVEDAFAHYQHKPSTDTLYIATQGPLTTDKAAQLVAAMTEHRRDPSRPLPVLRAFANTPDGAIRNREVEQSLNPAHFDSKRDIPGRARTWYGALALVGTRNDPKKTGPSLDLHHRR